ncbi:MAG: hypothetical protein ACOH16_11170 [Propionibacteriaceae bacterium]
MTTEDRQETTVPTSTGAWKREFLLELQLQGFDGIQISDALADVEARCAAAKRTPFDTFGDPVAHASYIRIPPPRRSRRSVVEVAAPVLGLAVGVNLVVAALLHWSDDVVISVGTVASMVALIVVLATLARFYARAIAVAVNLASCLAGAVALTMVMQWALPRVLVTASPVVALALGLLLVLLGLAARQFQLPRVVAAGRP